MRLFFPVPLVLGVYCLVEAISSRDDEVRNLSKVWWILLILFPFVGPSRGWPPGGHASRIAVRSRVSRARKRTPRSMSGRERR